MRTARFQRKHRAMALVSTQLLGACSVIGARDYRYHQLPEPYLYWTAESRLVLPETVSTSYYTAQSLRPNYYTGERGGGHVSGILVLVIMVALAILLLRAVLSKK